MSVPGARQKTENTKSRLETSTEKQLAERLDEKNISFFRKL